MPDKPAFSQSVGKAVVSLFRSFALAGLIAGSAALLAAGCTDNGGNGQFVPPHSDGAAGTGGGAGGSGGQGGDGAGGDSGGGTSGGGAGGTSAGGSGGGTGGAGGAGGVDGGSPDA